MAWGVQRMMARRNENSENMELSNRRIQFAAFILDLVLCFFGTQIVNMVEQSPQLLSLASRLTTLKVPKTLCLCRDHAPWFPGVHLEDR